MTARLKTAGFADAVTTTLATEDVPAADETPVNVLGKTPAPEPGEVGEADSEEENGKPLPGRSRFSGRGPAVCV